MLWRSAAVVIVVAGTFSMYRSRTNLLRTAVFAAALFAFRNFALHERDSSIKFARPASAFVKWMLDGSPSRPAGMSFKEFMYDCFSRDVKAGESANAAIGTHAGFSASTRQLRLMTYNVHFFQRGFSDVIKGDTLEEVLSIVQEANPDVLMLQEVPLSLIPKLQQRLAALGMPHGVSAGSADVHVLDPSVGVYANERLHVYLASRLPFRRSAAVPMLDGHAAFAEVELSPADGTSTIKQKASSALVYSAHLSVRCPSGKRREEVSAVLGHAQSLGEPEKLTLIAGDFNQANEADYPPAEWAAIAEDMKRAKLDLNDGAMDAMRAAGFVPTFEAAVRPAPLPATTAWNGALVDYIYINHPASRGHARVLATRALHTLASDHLPLVCDVVIEG